MKDVKKKKKEFPAVSVGEAPPGGPQLSRRDRAVDGLRANKFVSCKHGERSITGGKFPSHVNNSTPTP